MCCVSKRDPAVVYHNAFGLILEGEPVVCFDNDSNLRLNEDGTYDRVPNTNFTNISSIEELMGPWYEKFIEGRCFKWNEVVLAKWARIRGAFCDLDVKKERMRLRTSWSDSD
ncbi:MAG: hypothetical protein ACE5FT_06930, partial [Candidatus Nanoarchaeia archaeon]